MSDELLRQQAREIATSTKADWESFVLQIQDPELRQRALQLTEDIAFLFLARSTGRSTAFLEAAVNTSIQSLKAAGMIHVAVGIRSAIWKRLRQASTLLITML